MIAAPEATVDVAPTTTRVLRRSARLLAPHRTRVAATVLVSAVAATAELIGPVLVGAAIDAVTAGDRNRLGTVAVGYAAVTVVLIVARVGRRRLAARAGEAFLADLRDGVAASLLRQSMRFFDRHHAGALLSRSTSDVARVSSFVRESLPTLVDTLLLLGVTAVVLVTISWQLAAVALVYLPGQVGALRRYHRSSSTAYRDFAEAEAATTAAITETIAARTTLQGLGAETSWAHQLASIDQRLLAANDDALRADNRLSILGLWQHVTLAMIIVVGGLLADRNVLSVGVIATFALALRELFGPVDSLAWLYADAQQARTSLARCLQVLDLAPRAEPAATAEPVNAPLGLAVDDVAYSYNENGPALDGVTLHVAPGESVAVVGPTGSGKSTLARISAGLLEPDRGTVHLGGIPLRDWPTDRLRRAVVFVPQEGFVFRGTLADNLRLTSSNLTEADLVEVLTRLGLAAWLMSLPDGLQTPIADRGTNLSAGERQLVALARAAVADPAVLILDEATADIDPRTEALVADALDRLTVDRTVLVIAHRPATAARCDRIVALRAGRVVTRSTDHKKSPA